jgi:hypothetical protein
MIKKIGIGIGGVLVALIVIGLIVGPQKPKKTTTVAQQVAVATVADKPTSAPKAKPASKPEAKPAPKPAAPKFDKASQDYVVKHGTDAQTVSSAVTQVVTDITSQAKSSDPDYTMIATDAQSAHDAIDGVRQNFADTTDSSSAQLELFQAANDLKNAMGGVVAWTNTPDAAGTTAQLTGKLKTAIEEWNAGVMTVWTSAGNSNTPTIA